MGIELWQAVVLGIVEGITEFLPVSSTGHLTIVEQLLNIPIDDPAVTAYTAIIQVGAIAAAIIYFWRDIVRIVTAFVRGAVQRGGATGWRVAAVHRGRRRLDPDRRGRVCAFKDVIEGPFRSLWVVAAGLIGWSVVMVFAERAATQQRDERDVRLKDGLVIGIVQIFSLIPGVSRSGATISAGLLRDIDRVTATRLSFFLGIPALTAAGIFGGGDAPRRDHRDRGLDPDDPRYRRELRRRLRVHRVVATVRVPQLDHPVRLVPGGHRRPAHRRPQYRRADRDLTVPIGYLTTTRPVFRWLPASIR